MRLLSSTTSFLLLIASSLILYYYADVSLAFSASPIYDTIRSTSQSVLLDPTTTDGQPSSPLLPLLDTPSAGSSNNKKSLVVILPQLGEFDSFEYCEFLVAASDALAKNDISLSVIGIAGTAEAALEFCNFTGLSPNALRIDPNATIHKELGLHDGPGFTVPDGISDDVLKFLLSTLPGGVPTTTSSTADNDNDDDELLLRPAATAWLNYLAMCAGIGAKGTLQEILRGYFGDYNAPERLKNDDVVKAGFITIGPGVGPVQIGPLKYNQWFADEKGYQRPVELATVRLKNMVEVLTKWDKYVTNPATISQRGATYLFDADGKELYSYQSPGVLTYSETMSRPLSFLSPYIGNDIARNPLNLPDTGKGEFVRGRGILKPAGKVMGLLFGSLFKLETKLQAKLLGADDDDFESARKEIENTIANNEVVIYTYGLSPFSTEAIGVLDEIGGGGADYYTKIELGLEWFLLDKERSTIRAELLKMTGQSSLPHIFINGKHIGGLFTGGTPDGQYPGGLAGLKESGKLKELLL